MKQLPRILIFSRLFFGILIIALACFHKNSLIIIFLFTGFLTDILDGIIARKLNSSTIRLRRMDSAVDQLFWLCALAAACITAPQFFKYNLVKLFFILGLELSAYIICYLRFRKEVSTHSLLSKLWVIFLLLALTQIFHIGNSEIIFETCFYLGIISRIEIIAIIFTLREWTSDVPSLYHAIQLRRGKEIKRNKLFNG